MKPKYGYYALGYYLLAFAATFAIAGGLFAFGGWAESRTARTVGLLVLGYGILQPIGYVLGVYVLPENRVRRAERVLAALPIEGLERALDVGAGRGVLTIALAKRFPTGRVVAADVWQPESRRRLARFDRTAPVLGHTADRTRRNAAIEGVAERIDYVTTDARGLAFRDGAFDLVTAGYLLFHLHDGRLRGGSEMRRRALREFHRVLKPDGRLVVFELVGGATNVLAWTPLGFLVSRLLDRSRSGEAWVRLLSEAGFRVESREERRGNVVLVARRADG